MLYLRLAAMVGLARLPVFREQRSRPPASAAAAGRAQAQQQQQQLPVKCDTLPPLFLLPVCPGCVNYAPCCLIIDPDSYIPQASAAAAGDSATWKKHNNIERGMDGGREGGMLGERVGGRTASVAIVRAGASCCRVACLCLSQPCAHLGDRHPLGVAAARGCIPPRDLVRARRHRSAQAASP